MESTPPVHDPALVPVATLPSMDPGVHHPGPPVDSAELLRILTTLPNFKPPDGQQPQLLHPYPPGYPPMYPQQPMMHPPPGYSQIAPAPSEAPAESLEGSRLSRNKATMSQEEYSRARKDNHKEIERRRRGNINEAIDELGAITSNGSGDKSKGAILSRAVQYIHHLKDNEARNIEKWTLEKLLMDQAMSDLQRQLEQVRKLWAEEGAARSRSEGEIVALRHELEETLSKSERSVRAEGGGVAPRQDLETREREGSVSEDDMVEVAIALIGEPKRPLEGEESIEEDRAKRRKLT